MYRKAPVLEVGAYQDEYPTDEYGLWLRLSERGQMSNLADTILQYRMYATAGSIEKHRQHREAARAVLCEAHRRRCKDFAPELPADHSPQTVAKIHIIGRCLP